MRICAPSYLKEFPNSVEAFGCDFLDAVGNVIYHPDGGPPRIIFANTESGVVIQLARNPDLVKGEYSRITQRFVAPLRVIRILREYWRTLEKDPCVPFRKDLYLIDPYEFPTEPIECRSITGNDGHS